MQPTVPAISRTDERYPIVTNWTMVHDLIRAALRAKDALAPDADQVARNVAAAYLDTALMHVDEAHVTAERFRAKVQEFGEEKETGDDTNDDGTTPLISVNDDDGEPCGIWISCCEYVELGVECPETYERCTLSQCEASGKCKKCGAEIDAG